MRRSITGFALHSPLQDACFQKRRQSCRWLPSLTTKQSRQPFLHKSLAPTVNEAIGTVQLLANQRPGLTSVEQQYQSCATGIIGSSRLLLILCVKSSFRLRQTDPLAHTFKCTSTVTVQIGLFDSGNISGRRGERSSIQGWFCDG